MLLQLKPFFLPPCGVVLLFVWWCVVLLLLVVVVVVVVVKVLKVLCDSLAGNALEELNLSDNALGE